MQSKPIALAAGALLTTALLLPATGLAGPGASAAKKCAKGKVKFNGKCVKKPVKGAPAYGSYHSTTGLIQISAYASGTNYRITVRGRVSMTCLPSGKPGGTTAIVSDLGVKKNAAGKLELTGGKSSSIGSFSAKGTFTSASRLSLQLVVASYTGQGDRGDTCSGQFSGNIKLKPGLY
jgi:hypothetical protein